MSCRPIAGLPVSAGLPDPFVLSDGSRVRTRADWHRRRAELKVLLLRYQFGRLPPAPPRVVAGAAEMAVVCAGAAVERRLTLVFDPGASLRLRLTLTIPVGPGSFPVILRNRSENPGGVTPPEIVAAITGRGYMLAEYVRDDLQPDETATAGPARRAYPHHDWGTLAVWAWGGMRVIDYLATLPEADQTRILATGHSRGGKTALLTAALDERVAVAVPNASGGGGYQCWRFPIHPSDPPGVNRHESLALMSGLRAYWFHPGLRPFAEQPAKLPFDQHFLAALVAPRPLCAVEAMDDACCTPICVQRTFQATRRVYAWFGAGERAGVWFRASGGHAQGAADWETLLDFADEVFFGRPAGGRAFDAVPYPDAPDGCDWQVPPGRCSIKKIQRIGAP